MARYWGVTGGRYWGALLGQSLAARHPPLLAPQSTPLRRYGIIKITAAIVLASGGGKRQSIWSEPPEAVGSHQGSSTSSWSSSATMPVYTFGSGELGQTQAAGAFEAQLKDVGLMGGDNSDDEGASADAEQDGEEAQEGSSSEND